MNDIQALGNIIMGHRPIRPSVITDELWLLTEECWCEYADDRPDIWDVYNRLAVIDAII